MHMDAVTELYTSSSLSARVAAEVRSQAAKRGLRQVDLATLLNMSQPQISLRLRGKVPFRLEELDVLAQHFGIDAAEMMPRRPEGTAETEDVRRQGLEPRTRWFSLDDDETSSLATVLPFGPAHVRRLHEPRRIIRRAPHRTITPILGQLAVAR